MGREVVVAVSDGGLDGSAEPSGRASGRGLVEVFGPREQILYGEFDGQRWQTKSLKKLYAPGFIAW